MLRLSYILLSIWGALPLLSGQSCVVEGVAYYDYGDIRDILDKNSCNTCHSPAGLSPEWQYSTYDLLTTSSTCDMPIVSHGDASQSLLYDKLNGGISQCGQPMPYDRPAMAAADLLAVESWINNGATEYCLPFYDEVVAALDPYSCGSCHKAESSWSLSSYAHTVDIAGLAECGVVVQSGSAATSSLYRVCLGDSECVPSIAAHSGLPATEVRLVRDWINGGALESFYSLPVELSAFSVEQEDDHASVTWTSQQEVDIDHYEVQRSADAAYFETVLIEEGVHNSDHPTHYTVRDYEYITGLSYYRLKIVDYDGSYSYSHIVPHRVKPESNEIILYPNVVKGSQTMTLEWLSIVDRRLATANIVDGTGRQLHSFTITEGVNDVVLPYLNTGIYYLSVQDFVGTQGYVRFVVLQ